MTPTVIRLWPESVADDRAAAAERRPDGFVSRVTIPTLTVWRPAGVQTVSTGVIICPGGGYEMLAVEHEGAALARWLTALGITAFVLKYRVPPPERGAPLNDLVRAVRIVRSRAKEFGVLPERVGVMGASAGGHLAACAGTRMDDRRERDGAGIDAVNARPDFLILLYPVIALAGPWGHAGSRRALLGESYLPEWLEAFLPERHVTVCTPPAFLVHAEDDGIVPPENSRLFHAALRAAGVASELHVFKRGFHGFGLGVDAGTVSDWPNRCESWLRRGGWLRP